MPMIAALWMFSVLPMLGPPSALLGTGIGSSSSHWRLISLQTACEAVLDDYCPGRYGFKVQSDGAYTAGPSPNGRQVVGRIKPDELRRLHQLMSKFSAESSVHDRAPKHPAMPGIKDQIYIEFVDGTAIRAYELGGSARQIRHISAWDDARRLHNVVHKLLARYYPQPFPSE
jgi:hypothetical protein